MMFVNHDSVWEEQVKGQGGRTAEEQKEESLHRGEIDRAMSEIYGKDGEEEGGQGKRLLRAGSEGNDGVLKG